MNHSSRIIGIILVRNEDRFIEQVVNNVTDFCDQILLVDHGSRDKTLGILQSLKEQNPQKFSLHQITDPSESQELLRPFIGTATWIFGVDGDELYDKERLVAFRQRLIAGSFDDYWMILGNVLHCDELDLTARTASGYTTPPCRSITKLYNFNGIDAWEGKTPERLHGGTPHFRDHFHEQKKRLLQHEYSWEESPLRCLHLCFIPRSSLIPSAMRLNIMETLGAGWLHRYYGRLVFFLRKFFRRAEFSQWKQEHYARGERQRVEIASFFVY